MLLEKETGELDRRTWAKVNQQRLGVSVLGTSPFILILNVRPEVEIYNETEISELCQDMISLWAYIKEFILSTSTSHWRSRNLFVVSQNEGLARWG